mgnify:CR=1 FL=1
MPSYITPARYRTMGLGIDLSAKTDVELASVLAAASAEVNRYCNVPRDHDFRGGSALAEEHPWEVGNTYKRPSGKLWPYHRPLKEVTLVRIHVTKQQYIDYTGGMLFWNKQLSYIQPIAAPITTALITSIPPWLIEPPVAYIDYTYGWSFKEIRERLYPDGSKTYRGVNQFWIANTVHVFVNNVEANNTPTPTFTLDLSEGTVTFLGVQSEADVIEVSYEFPLPFEVQAATGIVTSEMLGYANINASGLTGLSGIKVEEIELRQSARTGFNVYTMHPAARMLLAGFVELAIG